MVSIATLRASVLAVAGGPKVEISVADTGDYGLIVRERLDQPARQRGAVERTLAEARVRVSEAGLAIGPSQTRSEFIMAGML